MSVQASPRIKQQGPTPGVLRGTLMPTAQPGCKFSFWPNHDCCQCPACPTPQPELHNSRTLCATVGTKAAPATQTTFLLTHKRQLLALHACYGHTKWRHDALCCATWTCTASVRHDTTTCPCSHGMRPAISNTACIPAVQPATPQERHDCRAVHTTQHAAQQKLCAISVQSPAKAVELALDLSSAATAVL